MTIAELNDMPDDRLRVMCAGACGWKSIEEDFGVIY